MCIHLNDVRLQPKPLMGWYRGDNWGILSWFSTFIYKDPGRYYNYKKFLAWAMLSDPVLAYFIYYAKRATTARSFRQKYKGPKISVICEKSCAHDFAQ